VTSSPATRARPMTWPTIKPELAYRFVRAGFHDAGAAVLLVSPDQCERDPPATGIHGRTDSQPDDEPAGELDAGSALAVEQSREPLELDGGRILVALEGDQHRGTARYANHPVLERALRHRSADYFDGYPGNYYCNGVGTPGRHFRTAISITTPTPLSTGRSPASARSPTTSPIS
jgi:hypothetical protein